ncbi:RNA 2'-phosphotransferase (plasmid) [Pontibacillus sp. ALD_SL1]|uniref:RNA 2'-phosphotransferase n=1 Tax=Pontibacillus sp. ALD_SL1 TaxID=2777185 RepID=UPI001A9673DE|nr:RNA 2'-phosphotransferase [Pontibacillus sp. ALD_SL1]QST02772.1 RNA 2'-phosphotransferase [Pontibacillus sp. ALD_SL1]
MPSLSKAMCFILRHHPEKFGIVLDEKGYCLISDVALAFQSQEAYRDVTERDIEREVRECPKQRFEIHGNQIRCRYGHSALAVSYSLEEPPVILLHGTHEGAISSIRKEGLHPMGRQYVHLSEDLHFASMAGKRRGKLVLLEVEALKAFQEGISFYRAGEGVWLSASIPPSFMKFKE